MQAVILAAGRGTRMKDLTENMPKPMIAVGRQNLIEWKINALPKEIDEVVLIVGYRGEDIKKHFGGKFSGKKIIYVEQKELNGTGGALFLARDVLKGKFLVMMGDDIYDKGDIKKMIQNDWAILAQKSTDKGRGAKIILNKDKTIKEIIEGAELLAEDWHNTGMYFLGPEIFDYPLVPKKEGDTEFGLPQTIVLAMKDIPVRMVPARKWFQITAPEDISKVEKILSKKS